MERAQIPIYKRLFFRLLLPVVVIGVTVSGGLVAYLTAPLERQLTNQFEANLRLSSMLGLQACEEAFGYLFEVRLEDNPEMNRTIKREVLEKIRLIGSQFPHIKMMVLSSGKKLLAAPGVDIPPDWQGPSLYGKGDTILKLTFDGKPARAFVLPFPFWDWHIISYVYDEEYAVPIRLAHSLIYWSGAGVLMAVLATLLVVYFLFVKRPLQQLIIATQGVGEGHFERINKSSDSELGILTDSFNTMVGSLEREKNEVRKLIDRLQESEAMFRSQFEYGNIGISITRVRDGQVSVNERLTRMLGYRAEELQTGDWRKITHPEDLVVEMVNFERMMHGEIDNYQIDKRVYHKNGELLFTHASISCDRRSDGSMRFIIASIIDITDRVRAQEARQESSRMLRLVLDTIPVRVFWKDRASVYLGCNEPFSKDAGLSRPEEVVGKNDYELAFAENADLYRRDDQEVMESGRTKLFYEEPQGREKGQMGWCLTSKVPMRDEKGEIIGILGTYHDITAQKEAEKELVRLRKYLANIIDSMPSLLAAVDRDLRVSQWNTRAMQQTGLTAGEVLGKPIDEVCPLFKEDREKLTDSISQKEVVQDMDRLVMDEYGSHYHDLTVYPLVADGVEGAVIRLDDVTEKHRMREQLNHRSKMDAIGQLAGGVAHDFNNMLSGIIGAAELLGMKLPPDPSTEMLHAMIIESAERAAGLTQKLLAFARKQQPASTAIDMHKTIRDAVALLDKSLDKRVRITVEEGAEQCQVIGDPSQLQGVFMNLGINASHAMPDGGDFTIATSTTWLDELFCGASPFDLRPGHYLLVEVRDTGSGIDPRDLPHIFEPFYTTKAQGRGTGLGLSAVFGTVQQHQGAITVYSEPGAGTVFHLLFPLTRENVLQRPPPPEPVRGSGTILIVDDEEVMRITAKTLLENLGYDVLLAENGRKALELYAEKWAGIDLILLDMIMPEMNGRDCFSRLRRINPKALVILSSGYSKDGDVAEMKREGLYGFLNKPYRIAELSREVTLALEAVRSGRSEAAGVEGRTRNIDAYRT